MTKKEKELLLVDLSARLPYDLKGRDCSGKTRRMVVLYCTGTVLAHEVEGENCGACGFVPYLRSMSSMTDKEAKEYLGMLNDIDKSGLMNQSFITKVVDWLDKKMFDHRGLIPRGIALEAPRGMYN